MTEISYYQFRSEIESVYMNQLISMLNDSNILPSSIKAWTLIDILGLIIGSLLGSFYLQKKNRKTGIYLLSFFCGFFGGAPTSELINILLPLERDPHPAIGSVICSGFFINIIQAWKKVLIKRFKNHE